MSGTGSVLTGRRAMSWPMTTADLSVVAVRLPVSPGTRSTLSATAGATLFLPASDAISPCSAMPAGEMKDGLVAFPKAATRRSPATVVVIDGRR